MPHVKRVSRVGNSGGLTFDRPILQQVGWEIGTEVEIKVEGDHLVLRQHRYASPGEVKTATRHVVARHRKSLDKLGE